MKIIKSFSITSKVRGGAGVNVGRGAWRGSEVLEGGGGKAWMEMRRGGGYSKEQEEEQVRMQII